MQGAQALIPLDHAACEAIAAAVLQQHGQAERKHLLCGST